MEINRRILTDLLIWGPALKSRVSFPFAHIRQKERRFPDAPVCNISSLRIRLRRLLRGFRSAEAQADVSAAAAVLRFGLLRSVQSDQLLQIIVTLLRLCLVLGKQLRSSLRILHGQGRVTDLAL